MSLRAKLIAWLLLELLVLNYLFARVVVSEKPRELSFAVGLAALILLRNSVKPDCRNQKRRFDLSYFQKPTRAEWIQVALCTVWLVLFFISLDFISNATDKLERQILQHMAFVYLIWSAVVLIRLKLFATEWMRLKNGLPRS